MTMPSATEQAVEPKKLRLYQAWEGNNRFLCGGRLIFGPDIASLFLSSLLIAGPSITFCYQIITKIHKHAKQDSSDDNAHIPIFGFPVLLLTLLITISDLVFLFITSSRDPGIVQRNTRPPEADDAFNMNTPSMEWISCKTPNLRLPRTKDVIVNGFTVKVKYCDTCMLYRPARASHCSVCNNCVKKFDHHCPWVGQCIGLRNYRFFYLFISTSTFLCVYVFIFSWLNIIFEKDHYNNSIVMSMKGEIVSLVLIGYTFVAVWFVGGLTVFHFYLMSTNQTTYENFRYRYDKRDNPYNKGFWGNFKDIFFSKIPPSEHDFRSWVDAEATEFSSYSQNMGMSVISPKEKIDIEMGSKLAVDGNLQIPSILQNLDYSSIEDSVHVKIRDDVNEFDPFGFLVSQKADTCAARHFVQSSDEGNKVYRDDGRAAEESNENVKHEGLVEQDCSNVSLAPLVEVVDKKST